MEFVHLISAVTKIRQAPIQVQLDKPAGQG